jgi:hypothetical protein
MVWPFWVLAQVWCTYCPAIRDSGNRRARSSLTPARPYIWRLSVLRRLMCPSTGPLLQGSVTAASTAPKSFAKFVQSASAHECQFSARASSTGAAQPACPRAGGSESSKPISASPRSRDTAARKRPQFLPVQESNRRGICLTAQPTLAVKLVWGPTRFVFPPAPLLRLTQAWSSPAAGAKVKET